MHNTIEINGAQAYHTYPDTKEKHPGLIVIEEIWGMNDHIRSVADRFASEGFSVLSPELLPKGLLEMLTPEFQKDIHDPEKRNAVQPLLREAMQPIQKPEYAAEAIAILKACVDYLLADEHNDGTVSVLGFCFGGSYSFHLAAEDARINAAIPFYGQAPSEDEVVKISCPILAFYGDQDTNLMNSLPKLTEDMHKYGKNFTPVVYEGVGHAFFNDTNAHAYDEKSAHDAWEKSLAFLKDAHT
jgi:carboxymethylenebutenolidase